MGERSTLFQSKYEVKYTPALQGFREMKLYLSENCANLVPEWTVLDLNTVLSDRPFVALLANYGDISYLDFMKRWLFRPFVPQQELKATTTEASSTVTGNKFFPHASMPHDSKLRFLSPS